MFHTQWLEQSTVGCWSIFYILHAECLNLKNCSVIRQNFAGWTEFFNMNCALKTTSQSSCFCAFFLVQLFFSLPRWKSGFCSCFFRGPSGSMPSVPPPKRGPTPQMFALPGTPQLGEVGEVAPKEKRFKGYHHHGNLRVPPPPNATLAGKGSFIFNNPLTRPYFLGVGGIRRVGPLDFPWHQYKNQWLFNQEMEEGRWLFRPFFAEGDFVGCPLALWGVLQAI